MTQVLYATLAGPNTTSDLYTVDPVTGAMTSRGPIGFACSGLAFDPTTDILYGCTGKNDATSGGSLIRIDTSTGAGTLIGNIGTAEFHEIAFDSTGQLWGNDGGGGLWQIDKATAVGVFIGSSGGGIFSGGLDFDAGGALWKVGYFNGAGSIGTQSLSDGSVSFVASCSDLFPKHSGKFDGSGVFWASSPGAQGTAGTDLVTVDVATGIVTPQASFSVPGVGGITWGPAPGAPPLRANFSGSPRHGGAPLSVNFTDLSTPGPSGPITGWAWTFGDGGTSTAQNPTYIYTTPGTYTVTLTVTGTAPDGTDIKTRTGYIHVLGPEILYAALAGPHTTSDLYTVDAGTGVMTSVGPIGAAITGLAQDPTSGFLYGSTSRKSAAHAHSLILIDTATGAGTVIGSFGDGGSTAHDIAFDSSGQLWGWNDGGNLLYRIDKATGHASLHVATSGTWGGGLDFDFDDLLWKVGYNPNKIGTVVTSTGVVTVLRTTSPSQQLHSGKFDNNGLFWASDRPSAGAAGQNLVTCDITTGTVTVIAPFSVSGVGGLCWAHTGPPPPNFTVSLSPSTLNVSPGVHTLTHLNTTALNGDTETITLSYTGTAGITLTFDTNPITAGGSTVVRVTIPGVIFPGVYNITIHCVGTSNSHDVTLTVHVFTTAPGTHIAS